MKGLLAAEGITVRYRRGDDELTAVSNVSVGFRAGSITLLQGASGSGKTTLLSVLGCMLRPDEGEVTLNGQRLDLSRSRDRARLRLHHVAFVFQSFRLFDTLTAVENVMLPLQLRGLPTADATDRARVMLDTVGLAHRANERARRLSGGEQQRVAVARALAGRPQVILADEPTAALDAENGKTVAGLLRTLAKQEGAVVVAVTHDSRLHPFADRIITLQDGKLQAPS
jgi:putative ABC transport system ATP-binding protein